MLSVNRTLDRVSKSPDDGTRSHTLGTAATQVEIIEHISGQDGISGCGFLVDTGHSDDSRTIREA